MSSNMTKITLLQTGHWAMKRKLLALQFQCWALGAAQSCRNSQCSNHAQYTQPELQPGPLSPWAPARLCHWPTANKSPYGPVPHSTHLSCALSRHLGWHKMYWKLFTAQVRSLKKYKSCYYHCYTTRLFTLAVWFSSTSPEPTTTIRFFPDSNTTATGVKRVLVILLPEDLPGQTPDHTKHQKWPNEVLL